MRSPHIDNKEIASLIVEETASAGSQRPASSPARGSNNTPGSFRSCWLIALALVAALFVGAFIADTMEININKGY
jgi:hypothetical protein